MRRPPAPPWIPRLNLAAARRACNRGLLALLCAGLVAACAPQRGLVLEPKPGVDWQDDGSGLLLSRAIERSVAYYRRLPPDTAFHIGEQTYRPAELVASLELFRAAYLAAPDAATLARTIARDFHVYESLREDGENLFTGYYEPELAASDSPTDTLNTPIYALPTDIVKVRLDRFSTTLPQVTLTGRVVDGELVPYFTRREIQSDGVMSQRATPIAYVNDVELFFLQVQGSGVLRFPDGRRVKVGYAASNGHPYRSIGALLVRDDAIPLEQVSLQSIRAWLAAHPEEQQRVLYANPSYVFFNVRDEGPLGNLRVELTPGRSLAVDQRLLPPGLLAYVVTEAPVPGEPGQTEPLHRFMLVQDTGGAIRGHGRADLFWGSGSDAEWIAGHQKQSGRLLLLVARKALLPKSTAGNP